MAELVLAEDGATALAQAEALCRSANISIMAAEHLLAAALHVASASVPGLPSPQVLASAAEAIHSAGSEASESKVMWGSSAREALNATVGRLRAEGAATVSARQIALGVIASGEVNPAFYQGLGLTKAELVALLG